MKLYYATLVVVALAMVVWGGFSPTDLLVMIILIAGGIWLSRASTGKAD